VIGNYQQGSSGVLDTEIGGPQPSQADQLKVNGSAKLDGTLDLTSLNNFHPSSGNSYEILSATGGVSGEFSMISDTANTAGLSRLDIYIWTKRRPGDLSTSRTGSVKPAYIDTVAIVAKSGQPQCLFDTAFGSDGRAVKFGL
jgi:outer membrane autotransporter protein